MAICKRAVEKEGGGWVLDVHDIMELEGESKILYKGGEQSMVEVVKIVVG